MIMSNGVVLTYILKREMIKQLEFLSLYNVTGIITAIFLKRLIEILKLRKTFVLSYKKHRILHIRLVGCRSNYV